MVYLSCAHREEELLPVHRVFDSHPILKVQDRHLRHLLAAPDCSLHVAENILI